MVRLSDGSLRLGGRHRTPREREPRSTRRRCQTRSTPGEHRLIPWAPGPIDGNAGEAPNRTNRRFFGTRPHFYGTGFRRSSLDTPSVRLPRAHVVGVAAPPCSAGPMLPELAALGVGGHSGASRSKLIPGQGENLARDIQRS